jgi:hypothetical protein
MRVALLVLTVTAVMSSALLAPTTALGQHPRWQMNGGGCVPTDATVSAGAWWVVTGGGRVKHKGTSLKPIHLVCPVSSLSFVLGQPPPDALRLYYQDTDGPGGNLKVTALLRRFSRINGDYSTPCSVSSQVAGQWKYAEVTNCEPIDLEKYIVWIQVVIERKITTGIAEFNAVELYKAP